jgi:hypothetical protein
LDTRFKGFTIREFRVLPTQKMSENGKWVPDSHTLFIGLNRPADFYLEKLNLIIEIKSSYTYNYDLEKNLSKEKFSKLNGYNFLFLIDKDYNTFDEILKNNL